MKYFEKSIPAKSGDMQKDFDALFSYVSWLAQASVWAYYTEKREGSASALAQRIPALEARVAALERASS